jgi:hypothetical protein
MSNEALSLSIRVMSSLTMACGLSRSADTSSIPRAFRSTSAKAVSGAKWSTFLGSPSKRLVRVVRKIQARRCLGCDKHTGQTASRTLRERGPWARNLRQWLPQTGQYLARPKKMIRTIGRKKYHTQITKGSTTEGNSALIRETIDEALPLLAGSRIGVHLGRLFLSGDFGKDARDKVEPVLDRWRAL